MSGAGQLPTHLMVRPIATRKQHDAWLLTGAALVPHNLTWHAMALLVVCTRAATVSHVPPPLQWQWSENGLAKQNARTRQGTS